MCVCVCVCVRASISANDRYSLMDHQLTLFYRADLFNVDADDNNVAVAIMSLCLAQFNTKYDSPCWRNWLAIPVMQQD